MLVSCPKCKSEYNAGSEYFGKSFLCRCGEEVFVPVAETKKQVAPSEAKKTPLPQKTSAAPRAAEKAPKATAPLEKSEKPEPRKSDKPKEKEQGKGTESKDEKKESNDVAPEKALGEKTFYAWLIKVVCVVCILTQVANFILCYEFSGGLAAGLPIELAALPIIIFLAIWSISAVFIFLFFAALGALFRLADIACRRSGIRPFPL